MSILPCFLLLALYFFFQKLQMSQNVGLDFDSTNHTSAWFAKIWGKSPKMASKWHQMVTTNSLCTSHACLELKTTRKVMIEKHSRDLYFFNKSKQHENRLIWRYKVDKITVWGERGLRWSNSSRNEKVQFQVNLSRLTIESIFDHNHQWKSAGTK